MKRTVFFYLYFAVILGGIAILMTFCSKKSQAFDKPENLTNDTIQWFVYENPMNGYHVTVKVWYNPNPCSVCNNCIISIFLQNEEKCYSVEIPSLSERYISEIEVGDTIFINNPTRPEGMLYFDPRMGISFADVDFDGKEELVVCANPCLDCEPCNRLESRRYLIYKVMTDSVVRVYNPIFDDLSQERRNFFGTSTYFFDSNKQTLTLIDTVANVDVITAICRFRKGEPFQIDYSIEAKYWNGQFLDKPHVFTHQFKLPQENDIFLHVMDSIWKCI